MAAEALRSEFLCSLTGLVARARDVGATPRGTRRFYPAIGGSFAGPRLPASCFPMAVIGCCCAQMASWNRTFELPSRRTTVHSSTFDTLECGMDRPKLWRGWRKAGWSIQASIISVSLQCSRLERNGTLGLTRSWRWGSARGFRQIRFGTTCSKSCKRHAEGAKFRRSHGEICSRQPNGDGNQIVEMTDAAGLFDSGC
jgi:hypothetical protein